jgi:hypothetical protein
VIPHAMSGKPHAMSGKPHAIQLIVF